MKAEKPCLNIGLGRSYHQGQLDFRERRAASSAHRRSLEAPSNGNGNLGSFPKLNTRWDSFGIPEEIFIRPRDAMGSRYVGGRFHHNPSS